MSKFKKDEDIIRIDDPISSSPVDREFVRDEPEKPVAAPEPESTMATRFAGQVEQRLEDTQQASEMYDRGEISFPEFALEGVGNAAGIFLDAVSEVVGTALSEVTPQNWKDFLEETVAAGGTALMETEAAKEALEVYNAIPERGKMAIESGLNIVGAVTTVPGAKKAGKALVKSAEKTEKKSLAEKVLGQGVTAKEKRAAEIGLPVERQTTINFEDRVLDTVLSVKGVKGSTSPQKIMGAINREAARIQNKINKNLSRIETVVPKSSVNTRVFQAYQEFANKNPLFASKSMRPKTLRVFEAYNNALKNYDGSAMGLLNLRREFDKNVDNLFSADIHAGDDAHRELVALVRNNLNDMVESLAPDDQVKALLKRQHRLLIAKSELKTNIAKSKSKVEKAVDYVSSHPFLVGGALSGGTGGLLGSVISAPLAGPAAMAGVGLYGATRPAVRRAAGEAIQRTPTGLFYGMGSEEEQ